MFKNNKGVTLIELLIVIIILGIIAAISTVAVGNIIENAQKDAFLADSITLTEAANLYCSQNLTDAACAVGGVFTNIAGDGVADWAVDKPNLLLYLSANFDGVYAVWKVGTVWHVAYNSNGYSFTGNPIDAARTTIITDDEDLLWWDIETLDSEVDPR